MPDIALLKRLTRDQFEVVVRFNPFSFGESQLPHIITEQLERLNTDEELITQLLLPWAQQIEARGDHRFASIYYHVCDQRTYKREQVQHAIRHGVYSILEEMINVSWNEYLTAGKSAIRLSQESAEDFLWDAFLCAKAARRLLKRDVVSSTPKQRGMRKISHLLEQIIRCAIKCAAIDVLNACLKERKRDLTKKETHVLCHYIADLYCTDGLDFDANTRETKFFSKHGNNQQKRRCLNYGSKKGHIKKVIGLSRLWKIPGTMHHLKLMLANHWDMRKTSRNDTRIEIMRKLHKLDPTRYTTLFQEVLNGARTAYLNDCDLIRADKIAREIGQPLTLSELSEYILRYGSRLHLHDQKKHIDLAVRRMRQIVHLKPNPIQIPE